jgi:hypothetical protein
VSGTLKFNPGETTKDDHRSPVKGDKKRESDETYRVNLSGADGATIVDSQGSGVIRNDDR